MIATCSLHAEELGVRGRGTVELAGDLVEPPRMAVVGSRAAGRTHREAVESLVLVAASRGYGLVSGGALGIDGEVHRVALRRGVPQLCVLPCGPDLLYPPRHAELVRSIAATRGSGVVFAQPRGTQPARSMFVSRNAIVVDLSDVVVVVQAAAKSGTMHTGRLALRRTKPLAVVQGSAGAAVLLAEGAVPLGGPAQASDGLKSLLDGLAGGETHPSTTAWPSHLLALRTALLRGGGRGRGRGRGVCVDELDDPGTALLRLAEAEALGLVVEVAPGRYLPTG